MTKSIYSAVKLPQEAIDIIKGAGIDLIMHQELTTPSEEEILNKSKDVDGIISGVNVKIGSKVIESANNLKIIANVGAGVNNIDMEVAKKKGVFLTNTPSRDSVASTAEAAIGLMLALSRNIVEKQDMVKDNSFNGWQVMGFLGGHQVSYKNLLIIGFGNIGQEIGRMAKAFNMDINYYDKDDSSEIQEAAKKIGAKAIGLEQGLKDADYVILQMNFTPENRHFIGEKELSLMKKESFLINTARGGIVDEEALANALEKGEIAGAALDVHEREPKFNERLIKMKNALLTPHIGNDTYEARTEMAVVAAKEAVRGLKGEDLQYRVI
ncbi:D-glycerate dehydrogenase [Lagierella sp.]|uniref:2-hydroxyacid dehydrogenase n=1 Tax=Lagierella sp. TaxID=2849657 RepID=UPI0026035E32|nr:D-glycerate dehydrogenase [Lagierella sp.]